MISKFCANSAPHAPIRNFNRPPRRCARCRFLPRAEFARAEEIRAFNRSVQQLNKRAARQGSQGEGHISVRDNHSTCLGPGEQRAIALRQFDALLESASEGVTLAASLVQEDAPERFWNPSECFTELYLKTRGGPLTQTTLKNLQHATALLPKPAAVATDAQQTLIAFNTRRDSSNLPANMISHCGLTSRIDRCRS